LACARAVKLFMALFYKPYGEKSVRAFLRVQPFQIEHEEDRILAVSRALLSNGVVRDEGVVLFTAAFRTFQKHASKIIEIHTLRELHNFWETQKL
jgi:hypothetical protein